MNEPQQTNNTNGNGKTTNAAGALALAGLATAGGWILYSATLIDHNLPLPMAINSERHLFTSGLAGLLNYYVDDGGQGRPLVLLHSINAAASSYEMRPLFEHFRGRRPLYALDLPGFGFSERSDRHYSTKMYAAAIRDFLTDVVERPADIVALSLSSEFAAHAALENPSLFNSLVLISPTGLSTGGVKPASQQARKNGSSSKIRNLLSFPLWSQAFYDLLVTKPSLGYFLGKSFHGAVDEGLLAYAYLTSHQPGARYAPIYFVSGELFTPGVATEVYQKLDLPSLIVYDQDAFTAFGALPELLLTGSNWSAARITPTCGLPHFEQTETTARVLENFWQRQ